MSRVLAMMDEGRPGWRGTTRREERWTALGGVVAVHLAVGLLLLTGLATRATRSTDAPLDLITLAPPVPPTPAAPAPRAERKEKAAAPPAARADPKPLTAPPPLVVQPVQLSAAPVAASGADTRAGAAAAGNGTGAGGLGSGLGGGGGGGVAQRAEWLSGGIDDRDYPDSFKRAGLSGQVAVRFTVRSDGRVADCRVDRSSGSDDLDRMTCALVERRLRYAPARDAAGRPVADVAGRSFTFVLGSRR